MPLRELVAFIIIPLIGFFAFATIAVYQENKRELLLIEKTLLERELRVLELKKTEALHRLQGDLNSENRSCKMGRGHICDY